jgi:hypothetical protein
VAFRGLPDALLRPGQEASECCLIFADYKRLGYERVYMNPAVKVRAADRPDLCALTAPAR